MAIDRRVMRTRTLLYDALITLVHRKPYDQITIEDILRQADVSRSTFYAHFTSKDDLLKRSLDRLKSLLTSALEEKIALMGTPDQGSPVEPSRVLFEHVARLKDVQLALAAGSGGALVLDAVDAVLTSLLSKVVHESDLPRSLVIRQIVGTFQTTLAWWLEEQSLHSADEVDQYFRQLLVSGIPKGTCDAFLGDR